MGWELIAEFAVGGTSDVGFSEDSNFLIVASSQGRGVFEAKTGLRVARDNEWPGSWHHGQSIDGLGPIEGHRIIVYGFDNPTPETVLAKIGSIDINSHITDFIAAAISNDDHYLALGYSSDVYLYKQAAS